MLEAVIAMKIVVEMKGLNFELQCIYQTEIFECNFSRYQVKDLKIC